MAHVGKWKIDEFKKKTSAVSDACKRYVNSLHYHLYLRLKRMKINCFFNASSIGNSKTHRCFFKKHVFCANEQCPFNYFTLWVSLGNNGIFMKIAALNYNRRRRNYVIFNLLSNVTLPDDKEKHVFLWFLQHSQHVFVNSQIKSVKNPHVLISFRSFQLAPKKTQKIIENCQKSTCFLFKTFKCPKRGAI